MHFRKACFLATAAFGMMMCGLEAAAANDVLRCKSSDRYHNSLGALEICHRALLDKNLSNSDRAALLLARGEAAYFFGRFDISMIDLNEALLLDPDLNEAYLRRAWTRIRVNDYPGALEDLSFLLSREPDNVDALFAVGYLYMDTNEWRTRAVPAFEQALAFNPNHYMARFNLASIYSHRLGNHEDAVAEYDRILLASDEELNKVKMWRAPGSNYLHFKGRVRFERAQLLVLMRRYIGALAELDSLAKEYPKVSDVFRVRAKAHFGLGRIRETLADARLAIDLDPYDDDQKVTEVRAHFVLKHYARAVSRADEFALGPLTDWGRANILLWRAYSLEALGRHEDALQDFEASISYDQLLLPSILTQLIQHNYYKGEASDVYSEKVRNGLRACIVDPECG
jgi:tetratricopeptide (TPR) repeat protein